MKEFYMHDSIVSSPCHVLIPCAGTGSRFGADIPKQFQKLAGKMVIEHSIDIFSSIEQIRSVWVGLTSLDQDSEDLKSAKVKTVKTGGKTRAQTVLNTLEQMIQSQIPLSDWVLVHDAARPGVFKQDVERLIQQVTNTTDCIGGILALPITDTVKISDPSLTHIVSTQSRELLWRAQTPQMFRIGQLRDALRKANQEGFEVTDEASAIEILGLKPLLVMGSMENFKITYQNDLLSMEKLMKQDSSLRIGQGYDVHRLVEGRDLILGGLKIPFQKGLMGHSDADALFHAMTDALLGAAGLGDIGQHFPDTDPQYQNADSGLLLEHAYQLVLKKGFNILNIDATIICQAPKLAQHIPCMILNIGKVLKIDPSLVNIKAKTNEGLGYLGNSEAIETQAVVLLQK
jgi:2-C-methyl-D-erythritol 4-phosphate cytidylyltransferase/2-C-methyl-D-erythritol 2,4-cyclodiphosphate synthase